MLCWNRKDDVREGLMSIFKSNHQNLEVIVVDNGSLDATADMVEKEFPMVKLIRLSENIGIAGYNVGFKKAQGKYVVVLDDDSYPADDALEKMVNIFEKEHHSTAILAFKIINPLQGNRDCTLNWPKEMISFWGCGAAIRREVLDKLGGYETDFFLYRNELEMSIRFLMNGYKTRFYPEIIAFHKSSPSNRTTDRSFKFSNKNDVYIFWNYYPLLKSLNYLTKIFIFTFLKAIFKYNFRSFSFIWRPFFNKWLWQRKYSNLKNRDNIQYLDHPRWREMNLIQPKLTDIPKRLLNRQLVW